MLDRTDAVLAYIEQEADAVLAYIEQEARGPTFFIPKISAVGVSGWQEDWTYSMAEIRPPPSSYITVKQISQRDVAAAFCRELISN